MTGLWKRGAVSLGVLTCTTVTVGVATGYDELLALLVALLLALGFIAGMRWPSLLLWAYVASIPFNFVVSAGPVGTIARVIGIVFVVGYLLRRPHVLQLGVAPAVVWAFVGWLLVSSLWAIDPATTFWSWLSLAQLVGVSVLIASIVAEDLAKVSSILWVYALSAVVTAVMGIVTYLQHPAIFLTRATAFDLQDTAQFASVLLPAIVYLTYRMVGSDTRWLVRALSAAGASACVIAVAFTGTRSAWIALAAASVVWVVLRPSRRLALGFGTLAVVVGVLAAVLPGATEFFLSRVFSAAEDGGAGRTDIWSVGSTIFASSPVGGVGFANFPLAFTKYAIDASSVSYSLPDLIPGRGPHNVVLGLLVETGMLGATLVVAMALTVLRRTGRAGLGIVVQVALVALLIQSLFLDILLQKQLWLLFALGMGLAGVRRHLAPSARRTTAPAPARSVQAVGH